MLWKYFRTKFAGNRWNIPVSNLSQVVPDRIYRSAAPDGDAIRAAYAELGIKSILDLRKNADLGVTRSSRKGKAYQEYLDTCRELGIEMFRVPMIDTEPVSAATADKILAVLEDPENYPILVHCVGGRHRTGFAIAWYRVHHEDVLPYDAWDEAYDHGFYRTFDHGAIEDSFFGLLGYAPPED